MTMENRRRKLQANPRQWGDRVSHVPYTGSARENFALSATVALSTAELDQTGSLEVDPSYYLEIPIPPNTTMISTKGWTLDSLINKSINFHHVRRVSALSTDLPQIVNNFEESGIPLVIEDCHKHQNWCKGNFTLDSFASATPSNEITVRNVHDWQDTLMPLSDFIAKSRSISTFAEEGEQERFYGKDAECPKPWENWLRDAGVVPQSLLSGGTQDLLRYQPVSSRVETLMCYLGVGDTFTPCHKDLCASSGQNLMCHTENNGSSFWFMTESASAPEVAKFFHSLGRELDHEDHVVTLEELSQACFKVYIIEQKLGDLVLVPARSAHQVVNSGGITVKTSWSRMTLKGLPAAYHCELPIYRRVCRPETYQVKSTIHYALSGLVQDLQDLLQHTNSSSSYDDNEGKQQKSLAFDIQELLAVYDCILAEEFDTHRDEMPRHSSANEANSFDDGRIICDFCGSDIFQSFFECRTCDEADSAEGGCVVCSGCYAEGRSCRCEIMQPMQRRQFKLLMDIRAKAIHVVDMYENRQGRTFQLDNDYCDINKHSYPRIFRAACILLDMRKKMKMKVKVCNQSRHSSHNVPFSWVLGCKMCHHAGCFSHILLEHRTHSVEALLLHNSDDTHQRYHYNHTAGRKARLVESSAAGPISSRLGHQQLAHYAINFKCCKPIKPQLMKLGWYDTIAHMSYISDDQESPSRPDMGPMPVPDTILAASTECAPTDVQQPTSSMRAKKRKVYVLVPPAPYRIPCQVRDGQMRSQAVPSTCAPPVTRHEPHQLVGNNPGQRVPPLQQGKHKVLKAKTAFKPSGLTLSDIGIAIPTTVRKSGSFIIHSSEVGSRYRAPAEETQPTEQPVEPVKSPRVQASKPPHVANPVTSQIITKKTLNNLKFKKSRPSKHNPLSSATIVPSSITQEGGLRSNLSESQPVPHSMPPGVPSAFPEELTSSLAEVVMHRVGYLLYQRPMNSFDMSNNSHGAPQPSCSHSHHYNGQPSRHNGPPQHYNGSPQHYNSPPRCGPRYGPPRYGPPHQLLTQHPYVHPQRHDNQSSYHAPPYMMANKPQFHHQDSRRPSHYQAPMDGMGYANHQPQYNAHYNGRNKMPAHPASSKKNPYKKRRYHGPQDPQSQTRFSDNSRFHQGPRSPQGPRGSYRKHGPATYYSTSQQVENHDGRVSRDHERLSWGTGSEGPSSVDVRSQSAHGHRDYHQRYLSNPETIVNNHGAPMDVDSNDVTQLETPLAMVDSVLDNDDTRHGMETPMDDLPTPIIEEEGNGQNWEDGYEQEERATEALEPGSVSQPAPAVRSSLDSIFNVDADSMADVTTNPWNS